MPVLSISRADDPRLADYRDIPDPERLERHGAFVAEGRLVVRRLVAGGRHRVRSVMVTASARAALDDVLGNLADAPIYVVPPPLMSSVAGFNIHRGCLAIAERPAPADLQATIEGARHLAILERVTNADNVGAVFRNAAAFGVDAVVLGPSCADPLYRKAIRTSMGAALSVPFAHGTPWPGILRDLRTQGVQLLALTPAADAMSLEEACRRVGSHPAAIVLGHEGEGLTDEARSACTMSARIPMKADIDSLNIATAAAIAMYELTARAPGRV